MSQWNRQHWICQEMQHIWGEHELSSESIDSLPKKNGNVSRIRRLMHKKSCSALNLTKLHLIWQEMQRIWVKFQLSLVSKLKVENGKGKHLRRTWTFITINWFHKVLDCFFFIPVDTRTEEFSEKFETTLAYRGQP